jgi:phosphoribosylanthranilate isomerase
MQVENRPLAEVIEQINALPGEIYAILLDSSEGTGREINLPVAARIVAKCGHKRVILAGRISATNIANIFNTIRPFGVDLSSSVEVNGLKSDRLISQFLETLRSMNSMQIKSR